MIPTSKECRSSLLAVFRTNENFSNDPYTVVPIGSLCALVLSRMNVSPNEFSKAMEKVKAHIQFSATGDKGILTITKGRNGGVQLREGTRF
jgi:hypothetical protein